MNLFWDEEVPYISLFGQDHQLYILLMSILLIIIISKYQWIRKNRETVRRVILVISIIQQIALYSWYIFETGFDIAESLPLHISRISSILGIVYLFTKNKKVMDVLFYFGLFAYGTFFYPSRVYPAYHIMGMSFFINHVITILLPIIVAIVSDWRPSLKAAFVSYGWFLLYFFFVYFLNPLIDGNYFYLKHRPFFGHLPDSIYVPGVLLATLLIFLLGHYLAKGVEKIVYGFRNRYILERN